MPSVKVNGIVLKKTDFGETSLVIRFFTKEYGKVQTMVKGAKRPKGNFRTSFGLLSLNEISLFMKKEGSLSLVSEAYLLEDFHYLHTNMHSMTIGHYFGELIDRMVHSDESSEPLYDLLCIGLKRLEHETDQERLARIFEIKALKAIGLMPPFHYCSLCNQPVKQGAYFSSSQGTLTCEPCSYKTMQSVGPKLSQGVIETIKFLSQVSFEKGLRIVLDSSIKQELAKLLHEFIQHHVYHNLKTRAFLSSLDSI